MKLVAVLTGLMLIASAIIPLPVHRVTLAAGQHERNARLHVVTSIEPLTFFVEEIGGDAVSVSAMVPPGANPHSYEPTPGQMVVLGDAQLFVMAGSGVEFELHWMQRFRELYPDLAICDAANGVELERIERRRDGHVHTSRIDPHFWLSPSNALVIASNVRDALVEADPRRAERYQQRYSDLVLRLAGLRDSIRHELVGFEGEAFLVFHPAWGYYAREFGLRQIAAEAEGKELTPRSLMQVVEAARTEGIRVVFVSPQFSRVQAESIAREIGGVTQSVDPLSADYIENLRAVTNVLKRSLR